MLAFDAQLTAIMYPRIRMWWIEPTYAMIDEIAHPLFRDMDDMFFDLNGFRLIKNWRKSAQEITFYTGATLAFKSADRPHKLRGPSIGKAYLDEITTMPNEDAVMQIIDTRMRGYGPRQVIGATTPRGNIGAVKWWLDGQRKDVRDKQGRPVFHVDVKTSYANAHLPEGWVDQRKLTMSAEIFAQEILAEVSEISGRVYPSFRRETHYLPWDAQAELRSGHWTVVVGVDWGAIHAHAVYLAVRSVEDRPLAEVWLFDELEIENQADEAMIDALMARLNKWPTLPKAFCPDPSNPEANALLRKAIKKRGLPCKVRYPDYTDWEGRNVLRGIELVRQFLKLADGTISMRVSQDIQRAGLMESGKWGAVLGLENYAHKFDSAHKVYTDKPLDDNTYVHGMDALRYALRQLKLLGFRGDLPTHWMRLAGVQA